MVVKIEDCVSPKVTLVIIKDSYSFAFEFKTVSLKFLYYSL